MDYINQFASELESVTGWDISIVFASFFTFITALVLWTRFSSGTSPSATSHAPPSLPYWVPLLGHLPQWLFGFDGLLRDSADTFAFGISSLFLGRETHHIVSSANLIGKVQIDHKLQISDEFSRKRIWRNVFRVPKDQLRWYHELVLALELPTTFHLDAALTTKSVGDDYLMRRLQGNIPDLVTFNPNFIDQEAWERVSAVKVSEDEKVAEVSLMPLVFLFLTHMTTDTFVSENLLSDADHQQVGPLLLAFIQSYSLLTTGLPRWTPHRTLPSAHITRHRLLNHLNALLDGTEDAETQNELLAARSRMFEDHKAPRHIRVIELLRLLHGLNAPHVLAFWMLLHIISDPTLLTAIRDEAKTVVTAVQDAPLMGFTVPPRVTIDTDGLLASKAPLLKRCWLETARLYSRGMNSYTATEDFDLDGRDEGIFGSERKWHIARREWVDAPLWLANADPVIWEEAEKWDPERHGEEEGKAMVGDTMVYDSFGLFGMDQAVKPARLFALAFVASALTLFDFDVDAAKRIPKPQFAAGVALPDGDVRVRIRKRALA